MYLCASTTVGGGRSKGKLFWIREYENTESSTTQFSSALNTSDANWTAVQDIAQNLELLNSQMTEMQSLCNRSVSNLEEKMEIMQAHIRHLAIAMVSVQVGFNFSTSPFVQRNEKDTFFWARTGE